MMAIEGLSPAKNEWQYLHIGRKDNDCSAQRDVGNMGRI